MPVDEPKIPNVEMTELSAEQMRQKLVENLANNIHLALVQIYGEPMGFTLLMSPFSNGEEKQDRGDYVSNIKRENSFAMIKAFLENEKVNLAEDEPKGTA